MTFLIPNLIGGYTAAPLIEECARQGLAVHIVARHDVRSRLAERLAAKVEWHSLASAESTRATTAVDVVRTLFTSKNLSRHYRLLRAGASEASVRHNLLNFGAQIAPNIPTPWLNRIIRAFLGIRIRKLPTKNVVAVTLLECPELLSARDQRVHVLMESWDHPTKVPAGAWADQVIGWNIELNDDWVRNQGASQACVGYPWKLRGMVRNREQDGRRGVSTVMYAAGTSSATHYPNWYAEELVLIELLSAVTAKVGVGLIIKPKPNGRLGDFDDIQSRHGHVVVGEYREPGSTSDYWLDDEYNEHRLAELDRCQLVINCWTTFALDAAVAGLPVLQLDLRQNSELPSIASAQRNYHISRYLLGNEKLVFPVRSRDLGHLKTELESSPTRAVEFSAALRSWLIGPENLESAVARVVDAIVGANRPVR